MQLWSSEFEVLRAEARRVIEQKLPHSSRDGADAVAHGITQSVRARRAAVARTYEPQPQADERLLGGVWCRLFLPDGPPSAVYLHFHGGGMVLGAPEMNDRDNLALSTRFGLAVVSVDYRLAPEHRFPDAVDDAFAVASWLVDHAATELGSSRLIVGGDDAGAYLAAAVLIRIRDELGAAGRFLGANLVSGLFDWGRASAQRVAGPETGADGLTPEVLQLYSDSYLDRRTAEERADPSVSPVFADLRDLCPALFSVGTRDLLLDDTLLVASRWAAAENPVELIVLPDLPHGFSAFPCGLTDAWSARTAAWLATLLR